VLLCAFLWVIFRRLNFICRRFGTLFHLHMLMKMEQSVPKRRHTKFRRRGDYPEESVQHSEDGESLKCTLLPNAPVLSDTGINKSTFFD